MKMLDRVIVATLSVIFIFAAVDKLLHYQGFVNALYDYVVVPFGLAPYIAPAVIGLELLVGIGLLIPAWRSYAALTAGILLIIFTLLVALNYQLGGRGICGCWFTITLAKGTLLHVIQNLLLAALASVLWWADRNSIPSKIVHQDSLVS
jgi:uncharacterized membrane protein YphA (DoxX/SURF4 family)